jgi:predicted NBD/HSP70 family sugar kinase
MPKRPPTRLAPVSGRPAGTPPKEDGDSAKRAPRRPLAVQAVARNSPRRQRAASEVLGLVRSSGPISRTELGRLTGLALSTVSTHICELEAAGLVEEAGDGDSRGGRRPRLVRLREDGGVVLAVDLGTHHARLGIASASGRLIEVAEQPLLLESGPGIVLDEICGRLESLVEGMGSPHVIGVGMGLPGPVEPPSGLVTSPSRMPGWHGTSVVDRLEARLGVPAAVDNDANLLALGEMRGWPGENLRHLIAVKVGGGIGCGIICNGLLYRGAVGVAGDISHVRLPSVATEEAKPCACGNRGCLETVASGAALLEEVNAAGLRTSTLAELVSSVHSGDPVANHVVRTAGRHLGEVLAVVVNFFNPQVLLLGGMLANANPLVVAVNAAIYERCFPVASRSVLIAQTKAGPDAGLLGAAALVLDRVGSLGDG